MEWLALILIIPYTYIITGIYFSLKKIKPYISASSKEISVSVVVACRKEEKYLPLLLSCLAAQDYDRDQYEVVIIDDGSSDSTYNIAAVFTGIKNYKVLKTSGSGKKSAIKAGVEVCRGELVITTDADCRMGREWLKTIAAFYSEQKTQIITGPVFLQGEKGFFQKYQELEFLSLQGVTAGTVSAGNPVMCNGANLSFVRNAYFTHADQLHPELISGDDVFLLHAVKQRRGKISWMESGEAVVTTGTEPTLQAFLKQRARWISKAGNYSDSYTKLLAIITFVTILTQMSLLVAAIFNPVFLLIWLAAFVIKSIPDLFLLHNRAVFNKKKNLLWFFLPGQLIYPFYVLSVLLFWLFTKSDYSK
ncbi:MAG: glycosyltransferase [Bacteroidota bacterium]